MPSAPELWAFSPPRRPDEIDPLPADHPHLKMPGASIEVFEAVSMPEM